MLDIALDAVTHDILLDNDIMFIDNAERVAQQVKIELKTLYGEWFLDTTHGVPYFEEILVKNPDGGIIETILREHILRVEGVSAINSLELTYHPKNRTLLVEFDISTPYGLITRRELLGYGVAEQY